MIDPDDRVLVRAVIDARDDRAFRALYDRHTPYLYRLALSLTGGDEQEAEEVTHDAWVRAVERFERFEGRSAFRTWLAGFVVNRAREGARRRWRPEAPPDTARDEPTPGAFTDRLAIEEAVARLPSRQRQVFVLHDVEGWTHDAIAEQLGITSGTSKSQLSRARAALRGWLEERIP